MPGAGASSRHLLVPPLDRAVAFEQRDDVAVGVGEDLDLDVPGAGQVLLDQHAVVAEGRQRLALGTLDRGLDLVWRKPTMRMPLPPPPAEALISTG